MKTISLSLFVCAALLACGYAADVPTVNKTGAAAGTVLVYKDPRYSPEKRASDLLGRMTVEENSASSSSWTEIGTALTAKSTWNWRAKACWAPP